MDQRSQLYLKPNPNPTIPLDTEDHVKGGVATVDTLTKSTSAPTGGKNMKLSDSHNLDLFERQSHGQRGSDSRAVECLRDDVATRHTGTGVMFVEKGAKKGGAPDSHPLLQTHPNNPNIPPTKFDANRKGVEKGAPTRAHSNLPTK